MHLSSILNASEYPTPLQPSRFINDYSRQLNQSSLQVTENKLIAFYDSTATEVAVVIEKSTQGRDISEYAIGLFNEWGIGDKKTEEGVLLYIALEDKKMFIVTGRGVEDKLPDAYAKRIVEDVIKPYFKQGNYEAGIDEGVATICGYVKGEIRKPSQTGSRGFSFSYILVIVLVIFIVFILPRIFRSGGGGNGFGGTTIGRGGYYPTGGWGSGGGSWGGGGGGGFGGFGGGSSGGGGAGGSW